MATTLTHYEDLPQDWDNHGQDSKQPFTKGPNAADVVHGGYQDFEYAELHDNGRGNLVSQNLRASPLSRFTGVGTYPLEQQIENKKRGIGRQKYPFVVWALTIAMVGVFVNELVVNSRAQGSPISFHPVVNPMLGPSMSALIQLGARFPACMKSVAAVPLSTQFGCLNNLANPPDILCSLEEICGFGGFHNKAPNQWFRFITPVFLHAGFVHILLNMLAQLTVSAQIEREMGSGGFLLTYFAAGIFGNVLGGNFALVGSPSVGASGAIFGTLAVTWVDLFAHWKYQYRPVRKLIFMTIELLIGIAIGYIPYVDNFAHLGGFLMGLLVGTTFYPVISATRRHKVIMWGFRLLAIPLAVVLFVVLIRNFYTSDPYAACSGCRYLSCFPTASNNHCKGTGLSTSSTGI
jgi:membrane associated rhomboid family serine protease